MPATGNSQPEAEKLAAAALKTKFEQGMVFHQQGKLADAERSYREILRQQPNHFGALHLLGVIAHRMRRMDRAIELIERAIALKPNYAMAYLDRGNVLLDLKRPADALASFDAAITLESDSAIAHNNRGKALHELRRLRDALESYDRAIALAPNIAAAHNNRGAVLSDLQRDTEALASYNKAIALKPNLSQAWFGCGNVFEKLHHHEDSVIAYAKVLKIDPQYPFAKGSMLHQKMLCCDWNEIDDLISEIDNEVASGKKSAEPFGYQAVAHSAQNFKRCAEIWAADRYPPSETPLWRGERYNNKKIRVGYLSGEFRNQVIPKLMTGLFELHDKNRFELFAFDNGWDDGSDYRIRINNAFDVIADISRLDDFHAATTIKQKQIDILVNLNGYFGEERNRVFSYKPAPIQVNYLGFSGTMGVDYIDYIIADKYIIPPEHKTFYTESVVYMPDSYQVNDTKRPIAVRVPTRREFNLPDRGFIFCCFNNSFKITPEIFDVWMRLLHKIDDSVLWLKEGNPAVSRNLRLEAAHRSIAPERLLFASRSKEYSDYLIRYKVADLFLDTLPFNAGATASDALWAGLPLLTCSGQTYAGRMAGSLLNAIGLPELITTTLDAYEQMAIDLATHPEKLTIIKRKLAENRLTTPLFDAKLFTKHIEAAYTAMFERHQAGLPPDHIIISK